MLEAVVVPNESAVTDDTGLLRIEAISSGIYHTPQYGAIPMPKDKLDRFAENFNKRIRGQDISTDFDHGMDRAKGNVASGWMKNIEVAPSSKDPNVFSLYAVVEPTADAAQEIKDKKWKYFSLEWEDEWMDNAGVVHQDVVMGGAFTNRPVAKNLMPINFSEAMWEELDEDTRKQFAVWTTAYVNSLPDSCFLFVEKETGESGNGAGASGEKETKKENRHLPYKDKDGKVDLPHLRNAIARIPQMKGISDAMKSSLQAKARRILAAQTKAASETATREAIDTLTQAGFDVEFSEIGWEHSEPGLGTVVEQLGSPAQPDPGTGQYVPRIPGDPASEDIAIGSRSRWEPLPSSSTDPTQPTREMSEGRKQVTPEQLKELMKLLGIEKEDEFVPAATKALSEYATLKTDVGLASQERRFAEEFPAMYAQHKKLLEDNRVSAAKTFSESVTRISKPEGEGDNVKFIPTRNGLSARALDTIQASHKKFAEGTGTLADFEEAVKTIVEGGIVEFGEIGSSVAKDDPVVNDAGTPASIAANRKLFAEKVAEVQASDAKFAGNENYRAALAETTRLYPELAEAYAASAAG